MAISTASAPSASPVQSGDLGVSDNNTILESIVRNMETCDISEINPSEPDWTVRIFCVREISVSGLKTLKASGVADVTVEMVTKNGLTGSVVTLKHLIGSKATSFEKRYVDAIKTYTYLAQKKVSEIAIPGRSQIRLKVQTTVNAPSMFAEFDDDPEEGTAIFTPVQQEKKLASNDEERIANLKFEVLTLTLRKDHPALAEVSRIWKMLTRDLGLRGYYEELKDVYIVSFDLPKKSKVLSIPMPEAKILNSFPHVIFE